MASCKKCSSRNRKTVNTVTTFNITSGHTTYTIQLNRNRVLQSTITGQTVNVLRNVWYTVYEEDLIHWINIGLTGIVFEDREAEFLVKTGILRERYVR